jgi:transcriptional regulator with XRE-family HTH domain
MSVLATDRPRSFSGSRLRAIRAGQGLSRERVAIAIGRTAAAVQSWELGRRRPSMDILAVLPAALGCEIGDLFEAHDDTAADLADAS